MKKYNLAKTIILNGFLLQTFMAFGMNEDATEKLYQLRRIPNLYCTRLEAPQQQKIKSFDFLGKEKFKFILAGTIVTYNIDCLKSASLNRGDTIKPVETRKVNKSEKKLPSCAYFNRDKTKEIQTVAKHWFDDFPHESKQLIDLKTNQILGSLTYIDDETPPIWCNCSNHIAFHRDHFLKLNVYNGEKIEKFSMVTWYKTCFDRKPLQQVIFNPNNCDQLLLRTDQSLYTWDDLNKIERPCFNSYKPKITTIFPTPIAHILAMNNDYIVTQVDSETISFIPTPPHLKN